MAIMVSDLGTAFPRTGPIATGMIALFPREIGGAVGFRAGQNIVHVRLIAAAFNAFAIFVKRRSHDLHENDNIGRHIRFGGRIAWRRGRKANGIFRHQRRYRQWWKSWRSYRG